MNAQSQREIRYRLLKILEQEPQISQRDMARRMGISLGKINYCVSELTSRGWVKVKRFNNSPYKTAYAYYLTPQGIEEKARLGVRFLHRKLAEYEEIRQQIAELTREVQNIQGIELPGHVKEQLLNALE